MILSVELRSIGSTQHNTTKHKTMMATVTGTKHDYFLPKLQKTFPFLLSYNIQHTIQQANAVGYILELHYDNKALLIDADDSVLQQPSKVFLKHVDAAIYFQTKQDWNDLRRTLLYARTEVRFYREFAPMLRKASFAHTIPWHYTAECHFTDWIPEDEHATASADASLTIDQMTKVIGTNAVPREGWLVLECIDNDGEYFQDSPISIGQAKECLSSVAALHVAAWENIPLLQIAASKLSKASFHLDTRNPLEHSGMVTSWDHFCREFHSELQAADLWNESVQNLGRRIAAAAHYISVQVTPAPADPHATIVHGDYKAMNVFLSKSGGPAKVVDYASTGIGFGMSDVAMHVHHAVLPQHLRDGGEEDLVRHYWATVIASLPAARAVAYSWGVAWLHYRFAVVDYFRFFLGRFWKTATLKRMEKLAESKNTCLLNRNVVAAIAFVRRAEMYLAEIESQTLFTRSDEDKVNVAPRILEHAK